MSAMADVRIINPIGTDAYEIDVDFDRVFEVTRMGIGVALENIYAPECSHDPDDDMLIDGVPYGEHPEWEALTGFTGQYSYNGPVLHASEYLGGGLARYIARNPGTYVTCVVEAYDDDTQEFGEPAGWTVLRLKEED